MNEDLQVRELSMEILLAVMRGEGQSHILLKDVLDKYDDWEPGKKAFLKKLTMGVLERKVELDYVISGYCHQPLNRMKPIIRVILEMGVYQILYMDHVYDTKACNLAVELAKKRGFRPLAGFVNGVLRSVARDRGKIPYPKAEENPKLYLSVTYSVPSWIVELLTEQYGFERTEAMLAEGLKVSPIRIHVKASLAEGERERLFREWKAAGVRGVPCSYLPDAYTLESLCADADSGGDRGRAVHLRENLRLGDITLLPGFEEGYFTVQDFSSQLVGFLSPLKAGDLVVDVCASPGGKSIYAADKLKTLEKTAEKGSEPASEGRVVACDVSEGKVWKMQSNVERMGLDNIECEVFDATMENEVLAGKADVLIADVPCSGLGVLGRKPDLKYRLTKVDLDNITELQRNILSSVQKDVKPGGVLLYSTCTVNREENEGMARWITDNLPFEELAFSNLPEELKDCLVTPGSLQLLPGEKESDGFFIAQFVKKE